MKIVYRNTPWDYPLPQKNGPGTVVLDTDIMPDWQVKQWQAYLSSYPPQPPPFIPTFRLVFRSFLGGPQEPEDHTYFASMESALWLAKKYGTGDVIKLAFTEVNWALWVSDNEEYHIRLKNGKTVNAGFLAALYERSPEDQFPGVADSLIRMALAKVQS